MRVAIAAVWLAVAPVAAGLAQPDSALSGCVPAARPSRGGANALQAGVLMRGVNLTDVLRPGVALAQVQRDMGTIHALGFRHVRLPISPSWVLSWPLDGTADASLQRLDAVVCAALEADVAVVLDAHPEDGLAMTDGAGEPVIERLAAMWDRLAGRYAAVPPDRMAFEALNEPGRTDAAQWARDQQRLLDHIRRAAPGHTVLLTASPGSTADALTGLRPVADANVAYVFHFYTPMIFTHQGADWATPDLRSVRGLDFPAAPGNVATVERNASPAFQATLLRYAADHADQRMIQAEIGRAADWAARNAVRLIVTEFGAFAAVSRPEARSAWLHTVRASLEGHGIGWTVWEYRGGFGVDRELQSPCSKPDGMRHALGLC